MVKEEFKPNDGGKRVEEEAMLREMLNAGYIELGTDVIRFGPPGASRLFLTDEEVTADSRPYRYPQDVDGNPNAVRNLYETFNAEQELPL